MMNHVGQGPHPAAGRSSFDARGKRSAQRGGLHQHLRDDESPCAPCRCCRRFAAGERLEHPAGEYQVIVNGGAAARHGRTRRRRHHRGANRRRPAGRDVLFGSSSSRAQFICPRGIRDRNSSDQCQPGGREVNEIRSQENSVSKEREMTNSTFETTGPTPAPTEAGVVPNTGFNSASPPPATGNGAAAPASRTRPSWITTLVTPTPKLTHPPAKQSPSVPP